MEMHHVFRALRDTFDDLAVSLEREAGAEVEAEVSITSNGAGLPRTRAFFDNARVHFDSAGKGTVRTSRGEHRLTWDVQGPRGAKVRIVVSVDGTKVADEGGELGDAGHDNGSVKFPIN